MNIKGISFYLSLFCFPISFLAFINILYASYFDYFLSINSYFTTLIVSLIIGLCFFYYGKNSKKNINFIEQLTLIIFSYFFTSLLIAIPFYLSNYQVTFLNSIFESISGITGTGFSIFKNIKYLDPTLILWRSSSQWVGGLFFLFFLIIIFSNKSFDYKMINLSYSGENNINSRENIKDSLLRILIIYSVLSILILTLLKCFRFKII
jgi:trk system potassium uptake protein TrkH